MAKRLPILSLLLLFLSCSVLIKKSYTDYTSSNFECWEGIGYRSSEKFEQYRNLWYKMRSIYREENQKIKTANAVFVGNSLIQLFPNEILTKEFPGAVNRGIGGDMTETLLERLEEDVISLNPKAIVLEIGGNDLIQGKCLYLIENNLVRILDKLTGSLPKTKIVILGIPPVRARSLNNISPVVNLAWISIIQSYENVIFLDNWQWFREKDRSVLRQEFWLERDEIHLNENAYKVWVEKLKPILLPYL
ncbi:MULTISPECIES: GDSL-type esterase/lipase family protein [Leptospira]|uniref:GDSL-like protein n=1 Tax=Leptospira weilii str. 2006001853 TaxID=1001589 RepID=A0A828Z1Q7_9LEPT|nr:MULTISPECIES: GDSL-type esterase/lipase family protein [Leptospira]EKR63927.1 GDSL-like protein [Leptospira weilii str. 2006001853]EMJ64728.1 GDSL-like protein [Leptospira sp. P2653]EMN44963.1 GDSL-like protein [Leptospira weilii str. LNT 1234]MCL8265359.1 GDSL-type esterase/lipase family protein [Leptospira weilii]MDL5244845.1 GDSL-type esterase/lipase family protein [Leptospira weilii]